MRYFVVGAKVDVDSKEILAERVKNLMDQGWILQGGVSVCCERGELRFFQAMIHEGKQ